MNIAHQEQFGNVLGLIYVILSLPASSADAERFQSTETHQEHHPIEPVRPTHRLDDCADDVTINRGIWSAHSPHTQSLGHRPGDDADSSNVSHVDSSFSDPNISKDSLGLRHYAGMAIDNAVLHILW